MSAKQYRILFFTVVLIFAMGMVIGGLPATYIQLVSGQGYRSPYLPTRGPTRTAAPTPTPSSTPTPTATVSPFDPFIGSSAPAGFQLPEGTTLTITEDALLHWAPDANASTGLFVLVGQEFPVSGVDETGEWIRISFSGESSWVRRGQTSLPPIRVQPAQNTATPDPLATEEVSPLD